ncbi:MAG: glycosyltransferase family 2 protein [Chloroflexota bacterium]
MQLQIDNHNQLNRQRINHATQQPTTPTTKPKTNHQGIASDYKGSRVITKPVGRATISGARFAIFFTLLAWLVYLVEQITRLAQVDVTAQNLIETTVYLILVTLLTASATAYLLARLGYFERIRDHRRVPRSTIDNHFDQQRPTLTVLVPSYREEERIIKLTLLSAALQEYPNLRVVLLIDDPPNPTDPVNRQLLQRSRALITTLNKKLAEPYRVCKKALQAFEQATNQAANANNTMADAATLGRLATRYDYAARWFEQERQHLGRIDHIDDFYSLEFLERMGNDLATTAQAIRTAANDATASISRRRVHQLYTRLVSIFQAEFVSFERKQFASLSHEPNKAMNLNSYIGLMGGHYSVVASPGGKVLMPTEKQQADFTMPDSDYILTLDADSMLLPEYCLRLVYYLEQPENASVAIAQTPYSAYRGDVAQIERMAGATTDIQHIVHLGLTKYDATFWVGANAVIRKTALNQIKETFTEAGFTMQRYVSDRTVIEDTESSIDLRAQGWGLHNYPERLSYSATPPDFGTLVIQRRRWANGGLVILPKLLRLIGRKKKGIPRLSLAELFLRASYLASISWASVSLLILLFYPFDDDLLSRFAVLTAIPYWWTMASDLKKVGYHRRDIFQVYGFNLLLLPVSLAGTLQSLVQAIGGQRTAFARTPKVQDRTISPLLYIALPLFLMGWSGWTLIHDLVDQTYIHGAFAALNLIASIDALLRFVGFRNIFVDIYVNIREFVYVPTAKIKNGRSPDPHWASILYLGNAAPEAIKADAPLAGVLAAKDMVRSNGQHATAPLQPHSLEANRLP